MGCNSEAEYETDTFEVEISKFSIPTMKTEFTKNQIELVEAVIGLFIIVPNPELKSRKNEITKIALELLSKELEKKD